MKQGCCYPLDPVRSFINTGALCICIQSDTVTTKETKMYRSGNREGNIEVLNISYVAGSIPDEVTGIFYRINPSGLTVTLGST
jgi:hypothetical protein